MGIRKISGYAAMTLLRTVTRFCRLASADATAVMTSVTESVETALGESKSSYQESREGLRQAPRENFA